MRVELLPSSIPVSESQFLVTFLVNDEVAIDGGSIGLLADLRRQQRVRHVFVTHEHLDHVATLPIFLENVYEPGPEGV
ncbi:MAG: MBL fold metallo-hydrolase, partial [Planctomycetia bacterium]|nr:MBL fold metallo-hydrolase [Planctomycetia bacterium]